MVVVPHNPWAVTAPIHAVRWISSSGYSLAAAQFPTLNHSLLDTSKIWQQDCLIMFQLQNLMEPYEDLYSCYTVQKIWNSDHYHLIKVMKLSLIRCALDLLQSLFHFLMCLFGREHSGVSAGCTLSRLHCLPTVNSFHCSFLPFSFSKSIKGILKDTRPPREMLFITVKKRQRMMYCILLVFFHLFPYYKTFGVWK